MMYSRATFACRCCGFARVHERYCFLYNININVYYGVVSLCLFAFSLSMYILPPLFYIRKYIYPTPRSWKKYR